jgi:hypothetical protein
MPELIEVSIDLVKCGQSVVANRIVRFRSKNVATNGSGKTVLTFAEEVKTDENGQATARLWPGIALSVFLPDGSKGNIVVPDEGTPSLDELLITSPPPTNTISAAIASAVATHAARIADEGILGHIIPDGVTIQVDPETGVASAVAPGGEPGGGDMLKADYDADNDGKVDAAETADAVPWEGITGKPGTFPPSAHTHDAGAVTSGTFDLARIPNFSATANKNTLILQSPLATPQSGDVWFQGLAYLSEVLTIPAYVRLSRGNSSNYGAGGGSVYVCGHGTISGSATNAVVIGGNLTASHRAILLGSDLASEANNDVSFGYAMARGDAPSLKLWGRTSASARKTFEIATGWDDDTDATRKPYAAFIAQDAGGNREVFRMGADGSEGLCSFFGGSLVGRQPIGAAAISLVNQLRDGVMNLNIFG